MNAKGRDKEGEMLQYNAPARVFCPCCAGSAQCQGECCPFCCGTGLSYPVDWLYTPSELWLMRLTVIAVVLISAAVTWWLL